jgi:hypothetical protein
MRTEMANNNFGTRVAELAGLTAENLVKTLGSFPPFGIGLDRAGKPVIYSKSADGQSLLTLEDVPGRMRSDAGSGHLIATAVVAIVQAAPSPSVSPRNVIAIQIEVPGQELTTLARSFKKGVFRGYRFGEPFVMGQPIATKVFE